MNRSAYYEYAKNVIAEHQLEAARAAQAAQAQAARNDDRTEGTRSSAFIARRVRSLVRLRIA